MIGDTLYNPFNTAIKRKTISKYLGGNCLCKLIESGVCQIKIRLI